MNTATKSAVNTHYSCMHSVQMLAWDDSLQLACIHDNHPLFRSARAKALFTLLRRETGDLVND